jgi:hypothetical protein
MLAYFPFFAAGADGSITISFFFFLVAFSAMARCASTTFLRPPA